MSSLDKILLTRKEAADQLGVSTDTLGRLISRGELRVVRIGRSVRIHREEIVQFAGRGGSTK